MWVDLQSEAWKVSLSEAACLPGASQVVSYTNTACIRPSTPQPHGGNSEKQIILENKTLDYRSWDLKDSIV